MSLTIPTPEGPHFVYEATPELFLGRQEHRLRLLCVGAGAILGFIFGYLALYQFND